MSPPPEGSGRPSACASLSYAEAFYDDPEATLDDLREAVTTLEEIERIARRVFGGAHPLTGWIGESLQDARDAVERRGGKT